MAASTPRKKNVKQLLNESQRAVRSVNVCTRADLVDEYETVVARREKAKAESSSIGGDPQIPALSARIDELRAEMEEATFRIRIRALPKREFTKLVAAYPPRDKNQRDHAVGFNVDEVVEQLIRQGCEEPDLDDDDWQTLAGDVLNEATWDQLVNAAWAVNKVDVSVPF